MKWFKRKKYGIGWMPATKEGWAVTIIATLIVLGAAFGYSDQPKTLYSIIIIVAILLVAICYKTGEKPRWQWG